jgi:hypothetical protein
MMDRSFMHLCGTAILVLLAASGIAQAQESNADFAVAFAAAQAAEKEAGTLKNQWLPAEQVLAAAKKAAASSDFATAIKEAKRAEALAKASIAQAREQETAWRAAIIH